MKKSLVCLTIICSMLLSTATPVFADSVKAVPNNSSVAVDGKVIEIGAYNINGYNYFKLRDIAMALNGTNSNFEVGYDAEAKCISLTTKKAYTVAGGELGEKPSTNKYAENSNQKIMLDGKDATMQAYVIDGYNYFQLRELGENLGFEVAWDDGTKSINMITKPQILDLSGKWTQEDATNEGTHHEAVITDNTITINWVNIVERTSALYWAGTFTAPTDNTEPYKWTSNNDTAQTSKVLLASTANTKVFEYKDGKIIYEAKAMGMTKTIYLVKAD